MSTDVGIQDGGYKTGSTNDVVGFPDTRVARTIALAFTIMYKTFQFSTMFADVTL